MTDVYDIKTFLFGFIYSFDYLFIIFGIIFFVLFYLLFVYFFTLDKGFIKQKIESKLENNLENRLNYLFKNINNFSREIFYREVSLFIKMLIFKKFKDKRIFFMTLEEIQNNFKNDYNNILKEIYYFEFNPNIEDNLEIRTKILKKLENL
ncbi:MAG: hypothetical protein PHE25_01800 [Candidatus Gracilibacteria bacterium]|nr:hypothetical protein [Candidatus Gracilibacteria bacterium]